MATVETIRIEIDPKGDMPRVAQMMQEWSSEKHEAFWRKWSALELAGAEQCEAIVAPGRVVGVIGEDFKALLREFGVVL